VLPLCVGKKLHPVYFLQACVGEAEVIGVDGSVRPVGDLQFGFSRRVIRTGARAQPEGHRRSEVAAETDIPASFFRILLRFGPDRGPIGSRLERSRSRISGRLGSFLFVASSVLLLPSSVLLLSSSVLLLPSSVLLLPSSVLLLLWLWKRVGFGIDSVLGGAIV